MREGRPGSQVVLRRPVFFHLVVVGSGWVLGILCVGTGMSDERRWSGTGWRGVGLGSGLPVLCRSGAVAPSPSTGQGEDENLRTLDGAFPMGRRDWLGLVRPLPR